MKRFILSLMVAATVLAASASAVLANTGDVTDPAVLKQLAQTANATAKYHNYRVALADGYLNTSMCVVDPVAGGMGVHFINIAKIMDPALNVTEPEILLYEPLKNGGYRLVGVEYMLAIGGPDAPIPTNPPPAPSLFGATFNGPMVGHGPGEPPHYDLHVWVWQPNPNGTFAQFNPGVHCP
ncbi:MAG: hypothetical protein M1281_17020 [Chloroflexi bacterium]|nr:hypothetical protein [Chloroflexota bacterium]